MLERFFYWLLNINLASWDALAAIGQLLGAGATVGTAWIALKQVKQANQQIEETRNKEKEALKPRVKIKIEKKTLEKISIIDITLANIKQIPINLFEHRLIHKRIDKIEIDEFGTTNVIGENIVLLTNKHTDEMLPKLVGDYFNTKIPIHMLIESIEIEKEHRGFFQFQFLLATGETFIISILLEYAPHKDTNFYHWYLYASADDMGCR